MDWITIIPGLVVAALGVGLSYWWFGLRMRHRQEATAGAQALSAMKPRECAGLVLEALSRQGYREESSSRQPGEGGGTEFLLRRGDDPVLMSYKHGTAYRLGDSNIREFANAIQLCGASHGLLVTLGSIEDIARTMARRYEIRLLDGRSVWPMVASLVPDSLQASLREQASERTRTGLMAGSAGSVLLGAALVFFSMPDAPGLAAPDLPGPIDATATQAAPAEPAPATTTGQPATTTPVPAVPGNVGPASIAQNAPPVDMPASSALGSSQSIEAANKALDEIAKLEPAQLAQRRAEAASKIAGIAQVRSASWSTQSTLVLGLTHSDGKDGTLVTEACERLARYEELRYTRLQLEPPSGSEQRVRWRMCQ